MIIKISPNINLIILIVILLSSMTSSAAAFPVRQNIQENQVELAIADALDYVRTEMNEDGGVRWFDESSSVSTTMRVVVALSAAGFSQDALISTAGNRPIDFLHENGTDWIYQLDTQQPGLSIARAGQLLTAIAAAHQNPHAFGPDSIDLVYLIKSAYKPDAGTFGSLTADNVLDQVWAILGLAAAHASIPEEAVNWLMIAQNPDGSWDDGFGSLLDTTPLGVLALAAAGEDNLDAPAIQAAVEFMLNNQQPGGGWQTEWDSSTNANTTGMMIQGLIAASVLKPEIYQAEIKNARMALLEIQGESGVIGGDFANAYSTAEAILGLTDQPLYNLGSLQRVSYAFDFIFQAQERDGGWGTVGQTLDVVLALTAAGWATGSLEQNGSTPFEFLAENLSEYLEAGPDAVGKSILGLAAAGQDPAYFNNVDLITELLNTYDPEVGAFGDPDNTWHQSLALLGLSAADANIPEGAIQSLVQLQQEDGGWEYLPGFGTGTDNTSLALQALYAVGMQIEDEVIQKGLSYIKTQQKLNGGWGDSSTTAFAMMALNSLGISTSDWITDNQKSPLENIFTYQTPSGGFYFSNEFPEPNLMSTTSAVLAVLSGSYIISPQLKDEVNHAGLIISLGEEDVTSTCVAFDSPTISGFELLDASALTYSIEDGFISSIMDISNPQGGTMYWSYWRWNGREWRFNNMGAADSVLYPGSIEAWHFTSWEVFPSLPPNYIPNLNQICNQIVLKNYTDQPYLNFWDLNRTPVALMDEPVEIEEPTIEDVEPIDEPILDEPVEDEESVQEPTPLDIDQDIPEESTRSILPLIVIGVVGTIVLVIILTLLIKKK